MEAGPDFRRNVGGIANMQIIFACPARKKLAGRIITKAAQNISVLFGHIFRLFAYTIISTG